MKRWFILMLFFPILLLSVFIYVSVIYQNRAYEEFMLLKLNSAMNRANDASVFTAKNSNTINQSINVELNPDDMWEVYKTVFLSSFNIYDKYHIEMIENYTPVVLIAVNNGYFMKMHYQDTNQTGYYFSQKIPYCISYENDGSQYIISTTMNRKNEYVLNPSSSKLEYYENGFSSIKNTTSSEEINKSIIRGIYTMVSSASKVSKQQFFIPTKLVEDTRDTTVNFKGISMIVLVQGFDIFTQKPIHHFTVSNTQLVPVSYIYCYEVNGNKYYTSKKIIKEEWHLKKIVTDNYIAAKYGYMPHPEFF